MTLIFHAKGYLELEEQDDEIVEAALYLRDPKDCSTWQTDRDIAWGSSQMEKIGNFNASDGWLSEFIEISKL